MFDMNNWWQEFQQVMKTNTENPLLRYKTAEMLNREFELTPYRFNPPDPVRTYNEVLRDGTAACAEAAAAIGAAMYQRGEPFGVCIKVDDLTKSAHVSIIDKSTGRVFDPYGEFFAKGLNCAIKPEILSL